MESAGFLELQTFRYMAFARSSQRSQSTKDDGALGERLHTLALLRPRWGYRRLYGLLSYKGPRAIANAYSVSTARPGCTFANDLGSVWD